VNQLYFGDNLQVLRDHLAPEAVDLIYLDPPFNSKRDYNLLFKAPKPVAAADHRRGGRSADGETAVIDHRYSGAQITAFEDSWHWGPPAEREFDEIVHGKNTEVSELMQALLRFLGRNDMMAYLTMMANRLLELHRVLKPTGALYLHCDPTASHYLKIVLDGVFGKENFRNDIIWKRASAHNDPNRCGNIHDNIFFYSKTDRYLWNPVYTPYSRDYIDAEFTQLPSGRFYKAENMLDPRNSMAEYDFMGTRARWRTNLEGMMELWNAPQTEVPSSHGRIKLGKNGKPTKRCRIFFLDDLPGVPLQTIWDDVISLRGGSEERLGYPTQKPLALLERIISASSNKGDVVLDPFCGCGTAVHAAHKLKRQWIGIDITHLAISLIEKRLRDAFGKRCKYEVHGTPKDFGAARNLATRDKYQFQYWAVSLVNAQPSQGKKKGADGGIDGLKFFHDVDTAGPRKIVVSVKGGALKADDVRALMAVREREAAEIALLLSLETPTKGMIADATSAGFYTSAAGQQFPRVQLLTIEGLLTGAQRAEHPDHQPDLNFKRAKAEADAAQADLI
jgi:DNA modification methylase